MEEKVTIIRKYIYEVCIVTLAGCVGYLFIQLADLNKYVRDDLTRMNIETVKAINSITDKK